MCKFQNRSKAPVVEPNLRLIGIVYCIVGALLACLGILVFLIAFSDESDGMGMIYVLAGAIGTSLGLLQMIAGFGLRHQSSWRFEVGILSSISILLLFPFGTVIGIAQLIGVVPRYRGKVGRDPQTTYHADW